MQLALQLETKKEHTIESIFGTFLKNPFASKRRKGECRFGTDFFIYRFWTGHEDFKEHGQAPKAYKRDKLQNPYRSREGQAILEQAVVYESLFSLEGIG
ncbi:hypothetical protein AYJ22_05845 [Ferroacidibacillus organovorans]|nr:hypothetical protein AYJ22_05845 [Ferroacidibacillus organovorans]